MQSNFPINSPKGTTLFDFVVTYSNSKLHTGAKSDAYNSLVDSSLASSFTHSLFYVI